MKVKIHDLNNSTSYEVSSPEECLDATDRSAAIEAFRSGETICMGKIIAEPKEVKA